MEFKYAKRMRGIKPSIIRKFAKYVSEPDIISFAGGAPAPELFPLKYSDHSHLARNSYF
ncbi:MAG: hypothetical protein GY786_15415 [Proteobacteria bacterium]|nr:hypothetical protein [Pseudomonadota bacterium]